MERYCAKCGKKITDEEAKFCPHCGQPVSETKKLSRRKQRELQDAKDLELYLVTEKKIDEAEAYDGDKLSLVKMGGHAAMKKVNVAVMIGAILMCAVLAVAVAVLKFNKAALGDAAWVGVLLGYLFFILIFVFFAVAFDRFYNILTLNDLGAKKFTVKKYGWGTKCLILLGGLVYEIRTEKECPKCGGEMKGEMHIEIVGDRPFAVCNMNREHLFAIDREKLLEKYFGSEADDGLRTDTQEGAEDDKVDGR